MTDTPPTDEQPTAPLPPRPRLTRSSDDRLIGGVAGGLGRHLNIDPLAIRITFVILSFAGGLGVLAYLACLVFVPTDDPTAPPMRWGLARTVGAGLLAVAALAFLVPNWLWGPELSVLLAAGVVVYLLIRVVRDEGASHIGRLAAKVAIGIVLLALAIGGFMAAAAGSALGGGIAIAGLIIACGVGLVGGAFRGGARWLIAPALVLALPLAAVAATDLDVRGTWGDRTFRPAASRRPGSRIRDGGRGHEGRPARPRAARRADRPAARDRHGGDPGPRAARHVRDHRRRPSALGAVDAGDGEQAGIDLDVRDDTPVSPGVRHLHLDVDIGVGALRVGDRLYDWNGPGWGPHGSEDIDPGTSLGACEGPA